MEGRELAQGLEVMSVVLKQSLFWNEQVSFRAGLGDKVPRGWLAEDD